MMDTLTPRLAGLVATAAAGLALGAAGCSDDQDGTDGCPVEEDALLSALRADTEVAGELANAATGLEDIAYHEGYATATTVVDGAEPAWVVFHQDPSGGDWKVLNVGTDGICREVVPADVIPRLPQCAGS